MTHFCCLIGARWGGCGGEEGIKMPLHERACRGGGELLLEMGARSHEPASCCGYLVLSLPTGLPLHCLLGPGAQVCASVQYATTWGRVPLAPISNPAGKKSWPVILP